MARAIALPIVCAAVLSSCAMQHEGKPVLTERIFRRLLVACHADSGKFIPGKRGLPPHFKVKSRVGETATEDKATPTVECMGEGVKPYRYDYFNVLDDDPPNTD
jgi:hypothetical protein